MSAGSTFKSAMMVVRGNGFKYESEVERLSNRTLTGEISTDVNGRKMVARFRRDRT
jgi:hypothetical protein